MRLTHLIPMLPVTDIHRSIAFYQDSLGFSVRDKRVDVQGQWLWCYLESGHVALTLSLRREGIDRAYQRQARGAIVFCFHTDDIASLHAALKGRRLAVGDLKVTSYGMAEFELQDPDGHTLCFTQPAADPAAIHR